METKLTSPFPGISQQFIDYISTLQQTITQKIQHYEPSSQFGTEPWSRDDGGGGVSMLLEDVVVFEKAGVNISAIEGTLIKSNEIVMFSKLIQQQHQEFNCQDARFVATGISLVVHPVNPFCPTVHMNYRYFEMHNNHSSIWWFGGGSDLTPAIEFEDDTAFFHRTLKQACDQHDLSYYPKFKEKCDTYFFLPHRNESRGVGGIFFDYLNQNHQDHYFSLCKSCGNAFEGSYFPIIDKRLNQPFSDQEKNIQLIKRGRYVEFNLLYDRGTLFGLKTGGRIESIFMSLPLHASWRKS